jgi:hypothetical protein
LCKLNISKYNTVMDLLLIQQTANIERIREDSRNHIGKLVVCVCNQDNPKCICCNSNYKCASFVSNNIRFQLCSKCHKNIKPNRDDTCVDLARVFCANSAQTDIVIAKTIAYLSNYYLMNDYAFVHIKYDLMVCDICRNRIFNIAYATAGLTSCIECKVKLNAGIELRKRELIAIFWSIKEIDLVGDILGYIGLTLYILCKN